MLKYNYLCLLQTEKKQIKNSVFSRSMSQKWVSLQIAMLWKQPFLCVEISVCVCSGQVVYQETSPAGTVRNQEGRSLFFLNLTVRRSRRRPRFPEMYWETIGVSITVEMNRENTVSSLLKIPQLHMSPRPRTQIHRKLQSKEGHVFPLAQQMASSYNSLHLQWMRN